MLAPEFIPAVRFMGRAVAGTNKWVWATDICPPCSAIEATETAARNAEHEVYKAGLREKDLQDRLSAIMGGSKALGFTLDAYIPKTPSHAEAVQACRAFNPDRENLYIWGPTGNGKTHLSCAVAAAAFRSGLKMEFFKPGTFLRSLRMKEPHIQDKLFERYAAADVFVLDDLGIGNSTDSSLGMFYELLDMRDMAQRHGLIVTSNLSLDGLAAALKDDRLPSRLAGMCRVIKIEGPDGRMKAKP